MVKHDDYMTPYKAWADICKYLPRDRKVWEAFRGDGTSAQHLRQLGLDVVCEDVDFFETSHGDCVVSNPPFSILPKVLERLRALNKSFVIIMPTYTMNTQYFQRLFKDIQVIVPSKRIQFKKLVDGVEVPTPGCSFDCLYYCWKMNLPRDIVFLT
jgi:hypothetical protein